MNVSHAQKTDANFFFLQIRGSLTLSACTPELAYIPGLCRLSAAAHRHRTVSCPCASLSESTDTGLELHANHARAVGSLTLLPLEGAMGSESTTSKKYRGSLALAATEYHRSR